MMKIIRKISLMERQKEESTHLKAKRSLRRNAPVGIGMKMSLKQAKVKEFEH